jgi:hypothetical protein
MKLEDQVCSLELANRLQKLGIEGAHSFSHISEDNQEYEVVPSFGYEWEYYPGYRESKFILPAWTIAELMFILRNYRLRHDFIAEKYFVKVFGNILQGQGCTLACALADVLINMIDLNVILVDDINNSLQAK